jgi:hypothetical protein
MIEQTYVPEKIVSYVWGYEQTNVDWFKIIKRKNEYVTLQPLKSIEKSDGNLTMTGEAYVQWTIDSYAWDWVAEQLNLTIIGDYVPTTTTTTEAPVETTTTTEAPTTTTEAPTI